MLQKQLMLHSVKEMLQDFGGNAGQQCVAMSLCALIYCKITKMTSVDDMTQIYDYSLVCHCLQDNLC